jgi:hypothetical protein
MATSAGGAPSFGGSPELQIIALVLIVIVLGVAIWKGLF